MTYLEIFIEENLATYKTGYINRQIVGSWFPAKNY